MPISVGKISGVVLFATILACSPLQAADKEVVVINTPDVSVANTPDVNVINTPDVNVANVPEVTVKNDVTSPIPITVQNRVETTAPTKPSDLVQLVTQFSPTQPGSRVSIGFALNPAGGGATSFVIPAGYVLIITDVDTTAPRNNAPLGRYVATICDTPCGNSRVRIQLDTRVDGFQKTISLRTGAVFKSIPQFFTLGTNPSDLSVLLHGYVTKDE